MKGACTVPRSETVEIVALTKTIDAAIVNILATLQKHQIAQDVVMDLAEIASATLYVRGQLEQALERGAKASAVDGTEVAVTS